MLSACKAAASSLRRRPAGSVAVAWSQAQQQLRFCTAASTDTHDDFKPVHKSPAAAPSVQEHIEKDVKENPVMVYMKGVPEAPQCGFSAMVVRILETYDVPYKSRNVLADPELRNGIKAFSKWPTIPQVYVNGEFVGGSDIIQNMHKSGELEALFKDAGIGKK